MTQEKVLSSGLNSPEIRSRVLFEKTPSLRAKTPFFDLISKTAEVIDEAQR